jgi:hypothetical protein
MQKGATAAAGSTHQTEANVSEGFRFFMPTTELTGAILVQNQRLVLDNIFENYPVGPEIDADIEDESLTTQLEVEAVVSSADVDHQRQILSCQRLVAERLYHYLSSLAESPWARNGQDFPISEYVPEGMATMLGFSAYFELPSDANRAKEIRHLLDKLTDEFRDWLIRENGEFVTPWIEIHLQSNDTLRLIAIEENNLPEPSPATEPEVGEIYFGSVTKVADYGAFVEILPGTDGLLHISEIANRRIRDVRDELKVGQQIAVKCIAKDGNRIKLSQKELQAPLQNSAIE